MDPQMQTEIMEILGQTTDRAIELILAPLNNQEMLWIATPLIMATLFMTLYFARYKEEELGWNTAFGNTMVFLFVALNILKQMYTLDGVGSLDNIFSNELYFLLSLGLLGAGFFLMFFTYFHLLPKRLAFFMFSAAPINVSVYVVMAIVYANLPADFITVLAGVVFLIVILIVAKTLQFILRTVGLEHHSNLVSMELSEELAAKVKRIKEEEKERKKLEKKMAKKEPEKEEEKSEESTGEQEG
jgi:hypothetical protein